MSSGYGLNGGVGRCFPFWQEVLACYVVNSSSEDKESKKKCAPALEDYYECLHNKKEIARVMAMKQAYRAAEAADRKAMTPSREQIESLGLIRKE
ncbi:uncharacterized protein BROUX77_006044 [Berkeleyomyces rouxiae]|uniref:uncharacterized protein n=1 Tax=Berkeleyomyces rouxiae TaxID=2035830 RepID=UPI003B7A862B